MDGVDYQSVEEVDEDEEDEIVKKLDKSKLNFFFKYKLLFHKYFLKKFYK